MSVSEPGHHEVHVRLSGPVEVFVDGRPARLASRSSRALLALLGLAAGRPVARESLARDLWPTRDLEFSMASLHTLVHRTRLATTTHLVETTRAGYRLRGEPLVVDAGLLESRFEARRRGDEASWEETEGLVATWAGDPMADLIGRYDWAVRERDRLIECYLSVVEDLAHASVRMGRAERHLDLLRDLVERHPIRESLAEVYLRALDAAGRTAEAFERYESLRSTLADRLGVDPSPGLQRYHQYLLRRRVEAPADTGARPSQLPPDLPTFVAREGLMGALRSSGPQGRDPSRVVVLHGQAGVGKTSAALHFAHGVATDYPGGQIFLPCSTVDSIARSPEELLAQALGLWGVTPDRLPGDLQGRQDLWRRTTQGERLLLVLDDARSAAQVRALLPATGSLVVATSRAVLTGLQVHEQARFLPVEPLDDAAATELISSYSTHVLAEEQLDALIEQCAGLPLLLAIAGTAVRAGRVPLAHVGDGGEEELVAHVLSADEAELDDRVLGWSYAALAPADAWAFRLLSLHPGSTLHGDSVASLVGLERSAAEALLWRLSDMSLVRPVDGAWVIHDLLTRLGARRSSRCDDLGTRRAAQARVLRWFAASVLNAAEVLHGEDRPDLGIAAYDLPPGRCFSLDEDATSWIAKNLPCVLYTVGNSLLDGNELVGALCVGAADSALTVLFSREEIAGWRRLGRELADAAGETQLAELLASVRPNGRPAPASNVLEVCT